MNVFVQGMRRSGTTILYDLLSEDPELTAFYEPVGMDKVTVGGGSGVRDYDVFESTRRARAAFVATRRDIENPALLNFGAPRDWRLEFEEQLPAYVRDFLRFLLDHPGDVVLKCTRLYRKAAALAEIDPEALFLHVVRDPRAVTASYLLGRRTARRVPVSDGAAFFDAITSHSAWASYDLSSHVLTLPGYRQPQPCRDFERILLLWRYTFEKTRHAGLQHFGDRYVLARHEDLQADPRGALSEVYAQMGRELPGRVAAWAGDVVRAPAPRFSEADARWGEAYDRLGLLPALEAAGYAGTW